jgi:hypothetical protein
MVSGGGTSGGASNVPNLVPPLVTPETPNTATQDVDVPDS